MPLADLSPLAPIESRLRHLLPADLYALAWVDPSPANLLRVFEHLRTLQRMLYDYVPRQGSDAQTTPGVISYNWQEGTLMFTDLAGFTRLMEANAGRGHTGAETLLGVLNSYFTAMIETISKSGGNLLEFTGDALLAQFPVSVRQTDTARAIRAGLRMQRAMERFREIATPMGAFALGMRVGIHFGRYLAADIGTPRRMERVLLGNAVQQAKNAESVGMVGRVCLTPAAYEPLGDQFRFEPGAPGYMLVVDDLSDEQLGKFDIVLGGRRPPNPVLLDRSTAGLMTAIKELLPRVESPACYLPHQVLNLLVETAADRRIRPDFPTPTVVFVTLSGLPEAVDRANPEEQRALVASFSRVFALINAAVEARGGVLKKVTYHLVGSDIVIYFGVPLAHTNDPLRAADAALAIRDIVARFEAPLVGGQPVTLECRLGITSGPAFAAEIGESRGRREFNVLGDTVNTAARLMGRAAPGQILMTTAVEQAVGAQFECIPLGAIALKGKSAPTPIFALQKRVG
jgi:adenylate cyclase